MKQMNNWCKVVDIRIFLIVGWTWVCTKFWAIWHNTRKILYLYYYMMFHHIALPLPTHLLLFFLQFCTYKQFIRGLKTFFYNIQTHTMLFIGIRRNKNTILGIRLLHYICDIECSMAFIRVKCIVLHQECQ